MKIARNYLTCLLSEDGTKVIAVGGGYTEDSMATTEILDLASLKWSLADPVPLPKGLFGARAVRVQGSSLLVGGRTLGKANDKVLKFDEFTESLLGAGEGASGFSSVAMVVPKQALGC